MRSSEACWAYYSAINELMSYTCEIHATVYGAYMHLTESDLVVEIIVVTATGTDHYW